MVSSGTCYRPKVDKLFYTCPSMNEREISCLPLSWYHFSSLPPLKNYFQKYLIH